MKRALELEVRRRADFMCEYCHMPQAASRLAFVIDHITARQHKGKTISNNLAFCCGHCNLHKGPNIAGIDPDSNKMSKLFNPRRDDWSDHFAWDKAFAIGLTPIGRATIDVLAMNDDDQLSARRVLISEGLFPLS